MKVHYFAYGSNLHPARLRARVPSAELVEVAVWPDRMLRFCKRSEDGSAKCTLLPQIGSRAFGAVYRLDAADKPMLDRIEGLGCGYDEQWQGLPLSDGVVRVFHYCAAEDYLDHALQPYDWYKQLVLAGARYHGFPDPYIRGIEQAASLEDPDPERRLLHEGLLRLCQDALVPTRDGSPLAQAAGPDGANGNLLAGIPRQLPQELSATLVETDGLRIERIVSKGHIAPAEGWFDQDRNEWVVLLRGAARLAFDDGREVNMAPGDWLQIPARQKHRVVWTDPELESVWLAVHYR
jgi:hypothetical protein